MTEFEIFLIYARAANGAIGHEGALPWRLPADLKRFKAMTMCTDRGAPQGVGVPMIMGRKTFESLPGMLPGRRHIVLTRRERWDSTGAEIAHSVKEAVAMAKQNNETGQIAVVGGAAIYDVFRPLAQRIEVTEIHADYPGDTFMKALSSEWEVSAREDHPAEGVGDKARPAYSFVTYHRHDDDAAQDTV